MHGSSSQAHLMKVDHPCFPIDLGVTEATRSADAQLVPAAEELSDTLDHVPANRCIGLTCEAETEVLGPSQQELVEPGVQFGPWRRVSPEQQSVDLLLESLLSFLRGPGRQDLPPGLPMPCRTKGVAQEVERLFSGVTEARFGGMDRQSELLQPTRYQRQAFFGLATARADDDKVIGIRDDLPQAFARSCLPLGNRCQPTL